MKLTINLNEAFFIYKSNNFSYYSDSIKKGV